MKTFNKRWTLINRRTGKASRSFSTRSAARTAKTANFRIFDLNKQVFVR